VGRASKAVTTTTPCFIVTVDLSPESGVFKLSPCYMKILSLDLKAENIRKLACRIYPDEKLKVST
jgi:hypothetical protein